MSWCPLNPLSRRNLLQVFLNRAIMEKTHDLYVQDVAEIEPMTNIFKNPLWIQHSQLHHRAKKWVSNNWPWQQPTMHDPWSPNYVTKIISWTNSTDTSINIIIVKYKKFRKDLSITKSISRLSSCNVTIFWAY